MSVLLCIDGKEQMTYYCTMPDFKFNAKEETIRGKLIIYQSKEPKWIEIIAEIPTRPIKNMEDWMEKKGLKDIAIIERNHNKKINYVWVITEAKIRKLEKRKGLMHSLPILRMYIEYKHARKTRVLERSEEGQVIINELGER